jgi:hypothetical protein
MVKSSGDSSTIIIIIGAAVVEVSFLILHCHFLSCSEYTGSCTVYRSVFLDEVTRICSSVGKKLFSFF